MLKVRIISALIALGILLLVLFVLPPLAAELAIALVTLAGAWEWSGLLRAPNRTIRYLFVAVIAGLLAALQVYGDGIILPLLLGAAIWWVAALLWVFLYPTAVPRFVGWLAGVCVLLPLFVALRELYTIGPETLLFVLLVVWAADVGAYFAGKQFGRVKLAPSISPGKTWEGVVGGLLTVSLIAVAGALWFEAPILAIVPFCIAVACLSIVGDLTVSIFKRTAGVKDSGKLFPGHGGILDRVDSVSAAAPLFALGLAWTGLFA
ncbi:MAG: phosphatidate cytidylyltransferase [Pseudomonadota bacterium]